MLQDAVVNVAQQNLAELVGREVHDPDGAINEGSVEQVLLHTLIGCAAGEASSSGSCGSGAAGQGGSAALTSLFSLPEDAAPEEEEAYSRTVQNVIGGLAALVGTDGSELANVFASAQAEVENNATASGSHFADCTPGADGCLSWDDYLKSEKGQYDLSVHGSRERVEECLQTNSSACQLEQKGVKTTNLTDAEVEQGLAQIEESETTLNTLYGDDEAAKAEARQAIAEGRLSPSALAQQAETKYQEDVAYLQSLGIEVGSDNGGEEMTPEEVSALADARRSDAARFKAALDYAAEQKEERRQAYDAIHGAGAYDALQLERALASEARRREIDAKVDAETYKLVCYLYCTAIGSAGIAVAAPAVGAGLAGGTALEGTVTFIAGGLFSTGLNEVQTGINKSKVENGEIVWGTPTTGERVDSALTGGLGVTRFGVLRDWSPAARGAATGFVSGATGNTAGQLVDIVNPREKKTGFDFGDLGRDTLYGTVTGAGVGRFTPTAPVRTQYFYPNYRGQSDGTVIGPRGGLYTPLYPVGSRPQQIYTNSGNYVIFGGNNGDVRIRIPSPNRPPQQPGNNGNNTNTSGQSSTADQADSE
ncbi:hypothetical protein [Alterisphingorhabdus coralli]|uniref:DUF637 domain-containing protein n=1 Tax=Alterisphingorhabdus coralli TaxID=3071408 RepID=A0AA97F492_9SPHN|nr:hypothetical protein [Parasphingorhabdus sp. SCSIO 66989]WOE73756.1 hypothetical protein RB602_07710 [Parasphingorhabdus sp. SCSIO 66989]